MGPSGSSGAVLCCQTHNLRDKMRGGPASCLTCNHVSTPRPAFCASGMHRLAGSICQNYQNQRALDKDPHGHARTPPRMATQISCPRMIPATQDRSESTHQAENVQALLAPLWRRETVSGGTKALRTERADVKQPKTNEGGFTHEGNLNHSSGESSGSGRQTPEDKQERRGKDHTSGLQEQRQGPSGLWTTLQHRSLESQGRWSIYKIKAG